MQNQIFLGPPISSLAIIYISTIVSFVILERVATRSSVVRKLFFTSRKRIRMSVRKPKCKGNKKQLAARPKSEFRYRAYMSRECAFFAGYHWFFSLIVGRRSTMNCPNCPSSAAFYDRPKWEIYAFYTKTDKSLVTLLKQRDSRLSVKMQLSRAKRAQTSWNMQTSWNNKFALKSYM